MTFTDENLRNFKRALMSHDAYPMSNDEYCALLCRLEAAEAMERPLNAFITFQGEKPRDIYCMAGLERTKYEVAKERIEVWKKLCGNR